MTSAAVARGQARGRILSHQAQLRHIGERGVTKSGRGMVIVAWRCKQDIDVLFDDGYLAEHRRYSNFKCGAIGHPDDGKFGSNWKYASHLGEEVVKPCGEKMVITNWENSHCFDGKFDDGTEVHCNRYADFKNGFVRNPHHSASIHNGEEIVAKNGLKAKILNYIDCRHVVIQFEDGTEIIKDYKAFKEGKLKHPNISCNTAKAKAKYEGRTYIANNGMAYTVIRYDRSDSILIRFADGTEIVTCLSSVCRGTILNPNYTLKSTRIGEEQLQKNNGIPMVIRDYRSATDVDVEFATGYLAKNKHYAQFIAGKIGHPFPYTMGKIRIDSPAYMYGSVGNFYCTCESCGMRDILTIPEMRNHICVSEER